MTYRSNGCSSPLEDKRNGLCITLPTIDGGLMTWSKKFNP